MSTKVPSVQFAHAVNVLAAAFAAFTTGSRSIPLGDNGALLQELAARTGRSAKQAALRDPFRKI